MVTHSSIFPHNENDTEQTYLYRPMGNEVQNFHFYSIALLVLLLYVKVKVIYSEHLDHFYMFLAPYSLCSLQFYLSVVVIWSLKQNAASKFVNSIRPPFPFNTSKSISAWCCNESDDSNQSESLKDHIFFYCCFRQSNTA